MCDGPHQGALFINKRHPSRQSTTRTKFQKSEVKTTPGLDIDSPCRPDESSHQPSTPYLSISLIPTPGTNGFLCFLRKRWEREDREWIDRCLQSPDLYPAAMLALDCLATAFFGKRHRQASIIAQAGCKYGKALVALRNTLQRQGAACSFDILAASTTLYRYELILCTSYQGWIQHAGGISRLIELSGPGAFECYPNRAILDASRYRIIHEAYWHRVRTFLERPEWTALKSDGSDEKLHLLKLQDFYARLARLTEDVSFCLAGPDKTTDHVHQTSLEAIDLVQDLENWETLWTTTFSFAPQQIFDMSHKPIYSDEHGPIFPSYLEYPSLRAAMGSNTCKALHLTALEWHHKLQNPTWWAGANHENAHEIPQARDLAIDICRSVHIHLEKGHTGDDEGEEEDDDDGGGQQQASTRRVSAFLFAVRVAYKMFQLQSREARWATRVLDLVAERSGFELARNLHAGYSPKWPLGTDRMRGLMLAGG